MRYVQMYYGWLYGGPPTARAYVTRAATFLVVGVTGFVVVSGVANVVGGQGAADAWIDALRTGLVWGVLMGLFAAVAIYADRHHRRRLRERQAEQTGGDNWR